MIASAHPVSRTGAGKNELQFAFLTLLPRIETHARIYFRHLKCPDRKQDCVQEVIALAWKWFVRLAERGKDVLLLLLAVAAVTWLAGLGLYQAFADEPALFKNPSLLPVSVLAVVLPMLASLLPAPWSYVASLRVRWRAAKCLLHPPPYKALAPLAILAALALLERLAALGARASF